MPELPEVEILVRSLEPLLRGMTVQSVQVHRAKTAAPGTPAELERGILGATFRAVRRRAKFLCFELEPPGAPGLVTVAGHLGMTGRMYLVETGTPLPKHAAVSLNLGARTFVFEDTRYFGRFTLDKRCLAELGPEPLTEAFTREGFWEALRKSSQPIKTKLLDQRLVAGLGNIYASEALFLARVSPRKAARKLGREESARLHRAIRDVLSRAIQRGSTLPLSFGPGRSDGLFYFGSGDAGRSRYRERLRVYDRQGRPCRRCGTAIRRIVQGGRSTFYCPACQRS